VDIFHQYKLVIYITISTVLNKLQSYYSPISALVLEGHCASCFKRVMCISCRWHVDVYKSGEGSASCGQRGSQKPNFLVDLING